MKNLYDVLGVAKTATSDEIKTAYRTLAKQHHPDKGGAAAVMQELSHAYEILMNPESRKHYDEYGDTFASKYEENLRHIFLDILGKAANTFGPEHLKEGFERVTKELLSQLLSNEKKCQKDLEGCKKALERVGPSDDFGTNTVRSIMQTQIASCESGLAEVAGKRAMLNKVLEAGMKMDYRDDAKQNHSSNMYGVHVFTTTMNTTSW